MSAPIRVVVADDHEVVRRGLRLFVDLQKGMEVVAEAEDGADAVVRARELQPDIVLMDLVMPGLDGIEATRLVREASPDTRVLVLSSFSDDERVLSALDAGADGYLTKDTGPDRLAEAIRTVCGGDPVFCPDVLRTLTRQFVSQRSRPEGTVTILLTDIEDSTPIVEKLGDEKAHTLFREHDALVRTAVDEHRGTEVGKEGDSFMVAFASAPQAVQCAVAAQRSLIERPLKVRMGLNTGDVIAERDGYFGRTVFVASRVAAEARGGEILVSEPTKALLANEAEVEIVDRGDRPLKGLKGRHRLYEVLWT
jgi:DNA-binding NarL/FixJ family response regulator